jgi:hypothetical protein
MNQENFSFVSSLEETVTEPKPVYFEAQAITPSSGSRRPPVRREPNAVLAMRFDCNEIASIMSEVAAYGTAVTVRKI